MATHGYCFFSIIIVSSCFIMLSSFVRLHRVALGERLPNDARDPEGQPGRDDHPHAREPAREPSRARLLGWVEPRCVGGVIVDGLAQPIVKTV